MGVAIAAVVLVAGSLTVQAQPLPPRPPTAVPLPTRAPESGGDHSTPAATGRITGTVIDLTTGAPAPGIAVVVGDITVKTDQNGNYDRNGLAEGAYPIQLDLQPSQGMPEQGLLQVDLATGATIVQHLAFRSQPSAAPTTAAAPPVATAPMPGSLPVTAAGERDSSWLLALAVLLMVCGLRLAGRARRN